MYLFEEDNNLDNKLYFEEKYLRKGYKYICGIDEVGRGSLFGEVTVAAIIMPLKLDSQNNIIRENIIQNINDSKKITSKKREKLSAEIIENAIAYSIYSADEKIIDEINILNATKYAMIKAIEKLSIKPDILLIDALNLNIDIEQEAIIKGDFRSYSIACASIIAKVSRDKAMENIEEEYKEKYLIHKNKGYGTKEHLERIMKYSPSNRHRYSFEPMKSYKKRIKINDH